ncbi:MAG: response regulator [Myxococcales bacterium]|nr:response regulator [Myxococcales bacterium]
MPWTALRDGDPLRSAALLSELSRSFSEAVSEPGQLWRLVAETLSRLTGDACTVRLLSDGGRKLVPAAAYHSDTEVLSAIQATMAKTVDDATVGVWGPVVAERKTRRLPVTAEKIPPDASEPQSAFMRCFGVSCLLLVPLVARGRVVGAMSLVRFGGAEPTDEEEAFLRDVANRAALAIDNACLIASERAAREVAEGELAERMRAEEELRRTQEQLLQAQKLEAVGRLAGGIAHDFNNLLSVILSYSRMLISETRPGDAIHEDLEEIRNAGERAATLTRQLLAFSRKQVLEPQVVDLNEIVSGTEKMIRRLLGEDIEVVTLPCQALGRAKVDLGQMEQVIMNLVVNARDAMPRGGRLTIETANAVLDEAYAKEHVGASAGPHVMLAISDTGTGMDKETQSRIFEPFFTTKEKGKGTGLGLSTVFGIVKQSGGNIWVYSEPGRGSTFKVYLPRTEEPLGDAQGAPPGAPTKGSETILLVEDEDAVRAVAREILQRNGYRVLEAANPYDALALSERHQIEIHLLLTDVVMPGMGGRQLAERLHEARPETRVLYMSGYTENTVVHHGVLQSGVLLLQKPLTPESLLVKVREALGASKSG